MSNIIKQKFKHGIFSYYSNDQYIGKSLSEYGEWSEAEVSLVKQLLADSENMIEVGSNIGTHTIPLAKQVLNGGFVYAIEPQYQNHKLLLNNIKDNELKNVEVLKVAISSKEGEAYMNTFDENITKNEFNLIDARSKDRFEGKVAEPRKGLRNGSIKNSFCLPYSELINDDHTFISKDKILEKFKAIKFDQSKNLVFSCGSGVTASVLALAYSLINDKYRPCVYDGSWAEYGKI